MAFEDALRGLGTPAPLTSAQKLMQAAYNSPDGERVSFRYRERLNKTTKRRLGENRYLGVNGVEYTDGGIDDTLIPWVAFFDDANHAETARDFERVLLIPTTVGEPGRLEHPRGEIIDVVVALVSVMDDPNHDSNQTMVRVDFRKQLTLPADKKDRPEITMQSALSSFNDAASEGFALVAKLEAAADRVAAAREFVSQINIIQETMGEIIGSSASILADFNAIKTDILTNMDTLLNAPAVLAAQVVRLVQFALDAPGDFLDKLKGYGSVYEQSVGIQDGAEPTLARSAGDSITLNRANVQGLVASSAGAAMMASAVYASGEYQTRQEAYEAVSSAMLSAPRILAALEIIEAAYVDTPLQQKFFALENNLQQMNVLKRLSYAATQQLTNKLQTTRIIKLARDTTILQICWDAYKDVSDETLQSLIDVNGLTVDEVALVPSGRELYV